MSTTTDASPSINTKLTRRGKSKQKSKKKSTAKDSQEETTKIQIVITKEKKQSSFNEPLQAKSNGMRSRRRSSSAIEIKTSIYAGPTFNNAPAPSSIPLPPAFSPTLVTIDLLKKEQEQDYLSIEKHSQDMMNQYNHHLFHLSQQPMYQRHSHHFYNQLHPLHQYYHHDSDLSEIQKDLRSLLKI